MYGNRPQDEVTRPARWLLSLRSCTGVTAYLAQLMQVNQIWLLSFSI